MTKTKVRTDLTGLKFGKLEVIEQAEDYVSPKGARQAKWLCKCDCGNYVVMAGTTLTNGKSKRKSCGCCNVYDLSGEYGICTTSNGRYFFFDLEDYDLIKQYCWNVNTKSGYVIGSISKHEKIYLHRLLMSPKEGYTVDHINHLKYDNRKFNLRVCTNSQNNMNKFLHPRNTTGYSGVYDDRNKYQAKIIVNNETINLGRYDNLEDAVKARKEAEEKYFGEYAYDTSQNLTG